MRKTQSRVQENKNFAHKTGEYKSGSVALLLQMLKQHLIGFDCYSNTFFFKIGSAEKCRTLVFKPLKVKMKHLKYSLC